MPRKRKRVRAQMVRDQVRRVLEKGEPPIPARMLDDGTLYQPVRMTYEEIFALNSQGKCGHGEPDLGKHCLKCKDAHTQIACLACSLAFQGMGLHQMGGSLMDIAAFIAHDLGHGPSMMRDLVEQVIAARWPDEKLAYQPEDWFSVGKEN